MDMTLTADAGNSSITVGLFEQDRLLRKGRLETGRKWTVQSMTLELKQLLTEDCPSGCPRIDRAILSSVVPELNPVLSGSIRNLTGREPLLMSSRLKTGIGTGLYDVSSLGQDRLADMAAAAAFYGTPAAVYDLGTCTTLSVIDRDANFIGGMISAGIQLSLDAEAMRTAQLPQLSAAGTNTLLGLDTVSGMISGSAAAAGILMDGVIARIRTDYHLPDLRVIVTGGNARYALPWLREKAVYDPDLLLRGLLAISRKNSAL